MSFRPDFRVWWVITCMMGVYMIVGMSYDVSTMRNRRVLILNADFRPLTAVSWQRAMQIVVEGSLIVLELARDRNGVPITIHSPGRDWDLPSVMMNPRWVNIGERIRYSRYNCFQRDDYTCQYCGDPNMEHLTIDHVRPKVEVKGREGNLWFNRVTCCDLCTGQKGSRSLEQMRDERCWNGKRFRLIREPFEPSQASVSRFVRLVGRDNLEWLDYIPGWEKTAPRISKGWLVDEYAKWKEEQA
jgi:hypothetical protein